LWKIADFGFTSKGASSRAVPSIYARGTSGYRAPELLDNKEFTNKVDIWALGCVLCELVTAEPAFTDDLAVRSNDTSRVQILVPNLPETPSAHLIKLLHEMLQREPQKRPRIKELRRLYESYWVILRPSIARSVEDIRAIPEYSEWKKLVAESRDENDLLSRLADSYKSPENDDAVISILKALVRRNPENIHYVGRLRGIYTRKTDWDLAIEGWKHLVDSHPDNSPLQNELASACDEQGDTDVALNVWKELGDKYPGIAMLATRHSEAEIKARKTKEEWQATITVLTDLVDKHPRVFRLRDELKIAFSDTKGGKDQAISVWKELVNKHPDVLCLQARLRSACDAKRDKDRAISVWMDLVEKHPSLRPLQDKLRRAFWAKGNHPEAEKEWRRLKNRNPGIGELDPQSRCTVL
jgi:tetratricopeptide (TPR) repeat protein